MADTPSPVHYQPNRSALERLRDVRFVAVVGPTAVGKTTLIKAAVAATPQLDMLVAGTSRPMREGETQGIDFHFDSKENMSARAARGEYVTVVTGANGDLYTTAPEDYHPEKVTLMATLAEAMPVFRALPCRSFRSIFILPPDWPTWRARLAAHNFTPDKLIKRLEEAARSLDFALTDSRTAFVVNDELSVATQDFIALALGRPLSPKQQQDQDNAAASVRELLRAVRTTLAETVKASTQTE